MAKLRIGIIYGGRSGEHEVSLASAASVIANLDPSRYEIVPLYIERSGRWVIPDALPTTTVAGEVIERARGAEETIATDREDAVLPAHASSPTVLGIDRQGVHISAAVASSALVRGWDLDVVFPVLHGPFGEDGTVQGLLELADVPYVGAGVLASAVGMDKAIQKLVFHACELPVVEWVAVARRAWQTQPDQVETDLRRRLPFPVFVKPANLGSSVGISKASNPAELSAAMTEAARHDRKIVVEAAVPEAREIECAVLGNDDPIASVPGEIVPSREFYDYEAKYLDEGSQSVIPAPLPDAMTRDVRRLALAAFTAIDACGLARVDFLLSRTTGTLYVNEVNTIPGFTTISMYAKLWEASDLPYARVLDRLIDLARERHADTRQSSF